MTTIDAQGNLHDGAGKFSEKTNSAPVGTLTTDLSGSQPSPVSVSMANYLRGREQLRQDIVAELPNMAPEGASALMAYIDFRGLPQSSRWIDEDGNDIDLPLNDLTLLDGMLEHFDPASLEEHGFEPVPLERDGVGRMFRFDLPSTDPDDEAALHEALTRASARRELAGVGSVSVAAAEAESKAAADYLAVAAKNRGIELTLTLSDQTSIDILVLEGVRRDGEEVDPISLDAYDEIDMAAQCLDMEWVRASGRFEAVNNYSWRFLG